MFYSNGVPIPGSQLEGLPDIAISMAKEFLAEAENFGYVSNACFLFEGEDGKLLMDVEIVRECHSFLTRWCGDETTLMQRGITTYEEQKVAEYEVPITQPLVYATEIPVRRLMAGSDCGDKHPLSCDNIYGGAKLREESVPETDEVFRPFYQWLVYDGDYAHLFLNRELGMSFDETMMTGLLFDARNVPVQVIAGLSVLARLPIECGYGPYETWNNAVNAGIDPYVAVSLCFGTNISQLDGREPASVTDTIAGFGCHRMTEFPEKERDLALLVQHDIGPNYNGFTFMDAHCYRGYGSWGFTRGADIYYTHPAELLENLMGLQPEEDERHYEEKRLVRLMNSYGDTHPFKEFMSNTLECRRVLLERGDEPEGISVECVMNNLPKLAKGLNEFTRKLVKENA